MVAVNGFVSVDCYKVELCCKRTVGVGCCNNNRLVLGKAACAILYYGKSLGKSLVKSFVQFFENLLLKFVNLVEYRFSLSSSVFSMLAFSSAILARSEVTVFCIFSLRACEAARSSSLLNAEIVG